MLSKSFDHAAIEKLLYAGWEASGAFHADPAHDAAPFTIMIPPPNVTGSLHMGHALTMTLQDTLIRWRRMQGRDALWQPGTDHAGIATQMVVERLLPQEGNQTRQEMGRTAFLDRVWQWKAESGGTITRQLRRLGASLDWPRERFTMDEGLSRAVREVFVRLYRDGLIYRDRRLVNWDPKFQSAISDLEVETREVRGHLWHLRYPIEGSDRVIVVATTRPETMLGDVAVAVHPDDERYRDLVGQHVRLPLVGRLIPIIADDYSDPEKGSGAVKITPAHDFNDFQVGQLHRLTMPSVLDREGRVTLAEIGAEIGGDDAFLTSLEGQDRFDARRAIIAEFERLELMEKIEPHTHQVPHGDRSGVPIEPLLTTQWYCNAAELAKPAIAAVESGRTRFVPQQWENTFFAWMRDIQPWCISRQLWWGHRIPAWFGADGHVFVAHDEAEAQAQAAAHYGRPETLVQDEDVLDTWFSSGLWPFSTLGWPDQTPELARYYPGDVLVTGFDIIFFWVARMMMMGLYVMDDVPFRDVYIHGLVRDERGQKMSKSKGNVIDPLELIDEFGTDALRFTVCALTGPGRDIKLGRSTVESYRSFVTKIWNAARFCEMNGVAPVAFAPETARQPLCRWMLDAANKAIVDATAALEAYRFNDYASAAYRLTWNDFCDWFLEFAKPVLNGPDSAEKEEVRATAAHVFGLLLRLLHPAMPFVTEHLWHEMGYGAPNSLIRTAWPTTVTVADADEAHAEIDWVVRLVTEVRSVRAEMRVSPSALAPIFLLGASKQMFEIADRWSDAIKRMARATTIGPLVGPSPPNAVQLVLDEVVLIIPLGDLVDLGAEEARLRKELDKALEEAEKVRLKLNNADFIRRAKQEVVLETKHRLAGLEQESVRLSNAIVRIRPPQT